MREVLLLASGGLDSTTLAFWLIERGITVRPLFLDYGQHCVEKEWLTVNRVLHGITRKPERVNISQVFVGTKSRLMIESDLWNEEVKDEELYVPYRTMLFFAVSVARAQTLGIGEVHSAFINTNHARELDCTAQYFEGLEGLAEGLGPVRLKLEFREYSKREVVELACKLGVPVGETYSCQVYSDIPCGACANCVERIAALEAVGLL